MKNNRKRPSFFSLLIKNYIVFTAVNISLLLGVVIVGMVVMSLSLDMPIGQITEQKELLEEGNYNALKIEKIVGTNGYIEILDANGQVIFSGGNMKSRRERYTVGEISCMLDLESPQYGVEVYKEYDALGGMQILVVYKPIDPADASISGWHEVLDANLKIVSSSKQTTRDTYTEDELSLLTGTSQDGYRRQKYFFKGEKGGQFILVANTRQLEDTEILRIMGRNFRFFGALFLLVYMSCIALFVLWLNRKVKYPLEKLNSAFASYVVGNKNKPINYKGTYEFERLCNSFNRMADKLNASEKEKQKMVADISHDLKTPITVIKGYAQAVVSGMVPKEEEKEYLLTLYQKAEGLDELINLFYDYSKMNRPDYRVVKEEQNLCDYIRDYLAEKYKDIYLQGFELEVQLPESCIIYSFDKVQLKRVFENILSNAIKHNIKGVTLYFMLEVGQDKIKITIADNGRGIPVEMKESIFRPFVMGDESRTSRNGSGLGLAIGKQIVEAHGGTIELIIPPQGNYKTQFEIILPLNNV